MSGADQSSAEVAREAESERAELASTLGQLRENLRPGNVVDEVMFHAKVNTTDVTDGLWRIAKQNPLPAALIGLGAAMLLGVGRKLHTKASPPIAKLDDELRNNFRPADSTIRPAYPTAKSRPIEPARMPRRPVDRTRGAAGSSGVSASIHESTAFAVRSGEEASAALRNRFTKTRSTMNQFPRSRQDFTSQLSRLLEEQPLVLAALGIAVGAAVGSAIPSTDVESQWMGDASESVRHNANAIAKDKLAQLKKTAEHTLEDVKNTAAQHGVSGDNLSGLVHDLGTQVKGAAYQVGDQAVDTLPARS